MAIKSISKRVLSRVGWSIGAEWGVLIGHIAIDSSEVGCVIALVAPGTHVSEPLVENVALEFCETAESEMVGIS